MKSNHIKAPQDFMNMNSQGLSHLSDLEQQILNDDTDENFNK